MLFIDLCLDLFLCLSHNLSTISLKGDLELMLPMTAPKTDPEPLYGHMFSIQLWRWSESLFGNRKL